MWILVLSIISWCLCFLCGQHHPIWEKMRGPIGNFSGYLTKLLDHSTSAPISPCWLPTNFWLGFTVQVMIQKPQNVCGQLANSSSLSHTLFPSLYYCGAFRSLQQDVSAAGPLLLNLHPVETLLILIWSSPEVAGLQLSAQAVAAHSRLRNSWQFFWVERLLLNIRDMKSAYTFGRVTAHYNHTASLECP